jgi:hypothetical protein
MPVDGNPAGIAHEQQDQQTGQGQLLRVPELGESDYHIRVSHGDFKPVEKIDVVEQPPLTLSGQKRHCGGKHRENQMHRKGIEADDHKICKPSVRLGGGQGPTRCKNFANDNQNKDSVLYF